MTANKPNISTDWSKADAYENTAAAYEDLPELDEAFFARAVLVDGRASRQASASAEAARLSRLQDAVVEIWGAAYNLAEVTTGRDGRLLVSLEPRGRELEKGGR